MPEKERSVLVFGEEPERVERLLPTLRRARLAVVRAEHASETIRLLRQSPFDLLLLVLPALGADRVLANVRAADSASRRAGVLLLGAHDELEADDLPYGRLANRLLPGGCSLVEFQQAVATLLAVSPRAALAETARLSLVLASGEQLELRVENLSSSGMLLRALDPPPVGTVFGFALTLGDDPEPVRGRARVVRLAARGDDGEPGAGAQFLALGGDAPVRIERLVARALAERANSDAAPSAAALAGSEATGEPRDLERCRAELAALSSELDDLLARGLVRRLAAGGWYAAGAELGLESIRAFAAALAALCESHRASPDAERRLADLVEARTRLVELNQQPEVAARVRILLALRPTLQRLLRDLADGGAVGAPSATARPAGVVAQTAVEIRRLVGTRRALAALLARLDERERPRLLPWRGGARPTAAQIERDFGPLAGGLGLAIDAATLDDREALRALRRRVEQEGEAVGRRLATIHQRLFGVRFGELATDDVEADLQHPKLHRVLSETVASGAAYLARVEGVYRHALEDVDRAPAMLERAAQLAARLEEAERGGEPAAVRRNA